MAGGYDSCPPAPPRRLGRYTTIRRLGAGGMAEVFLARSRGAEGTDKLLVVKRILPAFAANARFRTMFIDEARVALRLNHPNVVQVYGFESDGPSLLLVMEYVDGPDLSALAQRVHARGERIPLGLCVWLAREVARGLHYAHERRDEDGTPMDIVHRDVSPGNVLLSFDGVVKLGDFGIAKARLGSGEDEGAIKGKFVYMSPEQARTEPVDRRADVFSLGIVLGELVAGRGLFANVASGADLLPRLRRNETPDIHALAPHAPEGLRNVIASMIAADRTQRFASARDVAIALTRFIRTLDEEWDAGALELYLSRFLPRSDLPEPPTDDEVPHDRAEAATVARGRGRVKRDGHPSSRPPPTSLDTAALMRERMHIAVIVGRIVAPPTSVDTVDTRPLFDLLESLAFKADAALERTDEGRFTLVLGVVHRHVDHALRAAHVALDLVEAVQALAGDQGSDAVPSVALGLARGVAAVARGASGSLLGYEIVDDAVPFASSLAERAQAGEILVTPGFYRLVRRAYVLREEGSSTGLGARVWRLERMMTRDERERDVVGGHAPLVGRAAELTQLRDAVTAVRTRRRGEGLLVIGEIGIGKSALLATLAADLDPTRDVVRVPVAFGGADDAYRCVAQIVGELLGVPEQQLADGDVVHDAIDRALEIAAIGAQSVERASRRALRVVFGLEPDDAGNENGTAREIVMFLRRLLMARATMNAVVLMVDGVDLADRHSRAVLLELLHRPPAGPVLLVLALRDTDELVSEHRSARNVVLEPLTEEARAQLIARRFAVDRVDPEIVAEVGAAAGGNPLMMLEVIEALTDRGRIEVHVDEQGTRARLVAARAGELPLPATLEAVLAARIDALPTEARALCRWAALIDVELPVDLLEALAGDDAARAVGRLQSDAILVRARGRKDAYTFAHAALAKVARASIDPTQLAGMHARIAALLERRPSSRGVGAGVIARHREAAGAPRPAARAYFECASALRAAGQYREAVEAYARVLDLTLESSDPEGHALRFASHLGREEIARGLGRTRARRGEILAMRSVAVEAKDARLIARALARQARYKLETGLGGGIERDVTASTRAARRAGELRTEAEAKRVLAVYLGQCGRYAEGIQAANEALAALETRSALAPPPGGSADDGVRAARTVRVEVVIAKGALLRQTGEIGHAIEVYAEAYALLARHGPRRLLAHVCNNLGTACYSQRNYADALQLYLASIAIHRENGQRDRLGLALSNAGQTYAVLGDTTRAFAFLRKSIEVFDAVGARTSGSTDAHVALAELYCERGELDLAMAELERARSATEGSGSRYDLVRLKLGEAQVALARGEFRAARAHAEEAERVATEAGIVTYALHARAYAAEAAVASGDRGAARRFVDAVMSDSQMTEPHRVERVEQVLAVVERTLRRLGDPARADRIETMRGDLLHTPLGAPVAVGS